MESIQNKLTSQKLEDVSRILKTIAHPVKLEILQILGANEPVDVTTICDQLGDQCQISMLSHHLAKMKDNGIVQSEKIGKQVYYRLTDRHILSLFDCIERCSLA